LPYGSLSNTIGREELEAKIGQLFLGNSHKLSARCDENVFEDVMKIEKIHQNHLALP
jgi:hypothetical protein